jgi:hypothetical protein
MRSARGLRSDKQAWSRTEPHVYRVPMKRHSFWFGPRGERAKGQGKKKPGTFDLLGLTHIC